MFGVRVVISTLLAVATFGTTTLAYSAADDANLRADLERVAQRRIFFGHQSIGVNILEGIGLLSQMAGVPIHIKEVKTASEVKQAMIGQTFLAENGYPFKKLKSFEDAMDPKPIGLDVALMKFCFVDFTAETDVKTLFASYRSTIDALRAKNPGVTFVHVTAPLTVVGGGLKAKVKYFFGYAPLYGTLENMRREEYNTLLRQTYKGREPIFDLAQVESTTSDGVAETVKWKGKVVPVLIPAYSSDGAHLSTAGKLRAARELISVLAAIPDHQTVRKQ